MHDAYRTIGGAVEFRQKIERSEFLGIAFPATTEEAFFETLLSLQKKHFDATHHCWAFRLFADGSMRERSSDAGEPSGSAGKPILSAISGAEQFDCGVVVVRWYGGVKLGTGGLSRAYRGTAAEALRNAVVETRYLYVRLQLTVPFDAMSAVYRLLHPPDVLLVTERFGETNTFDLDVRASIAGAFEKGLTERRIDWERVAPSS
jgi:Uncharacterized conserved protein